MIKCSKKKWRPKRVEVDNLQPAYHSECYDGSKNSLTTSDPNGGDKERPKRKLKKMKSTGSRFKYMNTRSKSVPAKTVSFWPYVVHRFGQAPPKVKANTCKNNTCPRCCTKTGPRRNMQCRSRTSTERSCNHLLEPDSCMSACQHSCMEHDHCQGESAKTCQPEYSHDPVRCAAHVSPSCCFRSVHTLHSGQGRKSSFVPYQNNGTGTSYSSYYRDNSANLGATYVSDLAATRTSMVPSARSALISPGLKKWGPDAKYDFLLAKYSEHNYPKTHPARADYFAFQKYALEESKHIPNVSQNKSPSARLASISSPQPRSLSQTKSPRVSHYTPLSSSLISRCGNSDRGYSLGAAGPSTYYPSYTNPRSSSNAGGYQSAAMRNIMYDSLSQKYMNVPLADFSLQNMNAKSDSDMNVRHYGCRSPNTLYRPTDAPCGFTSKHCLRSKSCSRYDFADDMKLVNRLPFNMSGNASLACGAGAKSWYMPRSRSSDPCLLSGLTAYDDSDINVKDKYGPGTGADVKVGHRQFDAGKTSFGKFNNWVNTYDRPEDVKSSAKYISCLKPSCSSNSDDKSSNHRLASDSIPASNRSWFDESWNSSQLRSESLGNAKNVNLDSYMPKLNEPDTRRPWERFTNRRTTYTSNCDNQTSNRMKDNSNDSGFASDMKPDALDSIQRSRFSHSTTPVQFKDFAPMRRDESLSPICHRKMPVFSRSHVGSYLNRSDLSCDYSNTILKPAQLDGQGKMAILKPAQLDGQGKMAILKPAQLDGQSKMEGKVDKFSIGSDRKLSSYEPSRDFTSSRSYLQSARRLNFNQSQNSSSLTKPRLASAAPTKTCSLNITNTDPEFPDRQDSLNKKSRSSCWLDTSDQMLTSLMEQETERLNKVTGAIERQQDSS